MSILSFLIGMVVGAIIIIAIVTRKPRKMSDYDEEDEWQDHSPQEQEKSI